jgi:IS30 family transposase
VLIDVTERYSERMLGDVIYRLWNLKQTGLAGDAIGLKIGWSKAAVHRHIREHGGMRPCWGRELQGRSLSMSEREGILELKDQHGVREIARRLGRSPSTISRELRRDCGVNGYRATRAHALAFELARRTKEAKLATNETLRIRVQNDLEKSLSPEQISGRLRRDFPDDPEMQVSHETIYQSLYLFSRGGLKRELVKKLRTGRTLRKPKDSSETRRGRIKDMTLIAERPPEAADRAVHGHWEGDLIIGKDHKSAIGTVVERKTGYLILVHLTPGLNRVDAVHDGLIRKMVDLPNLLRRTLTWDQGTDLGVYSQEDLDYVAWEMNDRPRKRLDYLKPKEMIEPLLLR